jgi:integrase
MLPDYKLIGPPQRFKNGFGKKSASYMQRYRLLTDPSRKRRAVSLQTTDAAVARGRAVRFVEEKIRQEQLARDPQTRTTTKRIQTVLQEYLDDLKASGNTEKQASMVETRIKRVIAAAKWKEYAQVDAVAAKKAIAKLAKDHSFGAVTSNRYREALRAWSRWMKRNRRWPSHVLEDFAKIKGDDSPRRQRAILTDAEFEKLLQNTKDGPDRRNLSGEQRYWLYLVAAMTGLRAQELHSLKPTSFSLDSNPPYVEIACTVSKRRKTDRILLSKQFAALLKPWLAECDPDRHLWGCSASWFYKAGAMLRADLAAAGIDHKRGDAEIDFHSFRALRVTRAILSGKPMRTVMEAVRLSSEALLSRYTKIPQNEVVDLVEAIPMPKLPLKVVG